jgi:hypothetical protein
VPELGSLFESRDTIHLLYSFITNRERCSIGKCSIGKECTFSFAVGTEHGEIFGGSHFYRCKNQK